MQRTPFNFPEGIRRAHAANFFNFTTLQPSKPSNLLPIQRTPFNFPKGSGVPMLLTFSTFVTILQFFNPLRGWLAGFLFAFLNPFNNIKQRYHEHDNEKVHKQLDDLFYAQFFFVTGHKLAIVPVTRNAPGAHGLSSQSYFIPSHRT
jgi:hypothetical protein